MTIEYLKSNGLIQFEIIAGSTLYGLNTPTSDIDKKGIYVLPNNELLCMPQPYHTKISDERNDDNYYELKRFLELLKNGSPDLIEMIYAPDKFVTHRTAEFWDTFLPYREKFLTKQLANSFGGLAISQIKKARSENKKITKQFDEKRKSILEFCYFISGYSTIPLFDWLYARVPGTSGLALKQEQCGLSKIPHTRDNYALFVDYTGGTLGYNGIIDTTKEVHSVKLSSIPKNQTPSGIIIFNSDEYSIYCREFKEYWDWVEHRNPIRYTATCKHGKGYNCYQNSTTEFLTKTGWKCYDQITELDYLGTLNPVTFEMEWQQFINKFDDIYNGTIYTFENRYTRFSVTENHNLFVANTSRNPTTKYSTNRSGEFYFESVMNYFSGKRSYKHILISAHKNSKIPDYNISDELLILMGLYISEGALIKTKKKSPKGLSMSQTKFADFRILMDKIIPHFNFHIYKHNKFNEDATLFNIYDAKLAKYIKFQCGEYSELKKLPEFMFELSTRQVELLLRALMSGDGHKHPKGHWVYYSNSMQLIDQLYTVLTLHGYNAQIYPYNDTKQLFISKSKTISQCISKINTRNFSWNRRQVINERVVCFEVDNSILITKNNNKIAFQGNSKNMMHAIRGLDMGIEIASGKGVICNRENRDFYLNIKNGIVDYDDILEMANERFDTMTKLFQYSNLPEDIDESVLNEILMKIRFQNNKC
jgi:predicted nucleotidyltransferase